MVMEQLAGNYMKWNYCKYKLEKFTPNSLKLIKTFIIQNHQNYKETEENLHDVGFDPYIISFEF